ncbi:MAG: hypothetical protein AUJ89_04455 [Candidatus Omnitrophica bacterium CG1_02_43_210]|nr:MAG: hypothetical protein AUJ89_04455 [Candidatus Omnitrophica bacterium CG1_02_43_210]
MDSSAKIRILICHVTLCAAFLLLFICEASANNISVTNASITGQSTSAETCKVQFDISWENSWRHALNYDAAWVFIKYSTDSGATWSHATLKTSGTNPANFSQGAGTGLDIVVPTDLKGAFLERTSNGVGSVSTVSIQFVWDWGANGLSAGTTARVKVFAIEMVYIPESVFYAGDNASSTASLKQGSADSNPWYVNDSDAMAMNGGEFYYVTGSNTGEGATGAAFTIPAAFPSGFDAFYIMKYEISQGQYRDFLNTLTRAQQNTRTVSQTASQFVMSNNAAVVYRNGLRAPASIPAGAITFGCDFDANGTFDESTDGEWIACNYLSWMDIAAYADWAGLRPFSELEFEKAARGNLTSINSEYAWGSTSITDAATLANSGLTNEGVSETGAGLCNYGNDGVQAPLRTGFAATSTTKRAQAGASYYGVMELSGNNRERCVTVGNSTGRAFTGTAGNGSLSSNGNTDNSDWPGYVGSEVTAATGSGFRGGDWSGAIGLLCISDRASAANTDTTRDTTYGGRCARTSP